MPLKVQHDQNRHQFIAIIEGKACTLSYSIMESDRVLDYTRTFVPLELRGRQIGQDLVKYALDYAKKNNLKVIPTCSFVKIYIDHHPEYEGIRYKE